MPLFNANIDLDNNQLQNAVVHSGSTKPSSGLAAGQIFYDTDSNQLQLYTGSDWEGVVTETKDGTTITDVTSILNSSLVVGRDSTDLIDFSTDNSIIFKINNANRLRLDASQMYPVTSDGVSLGTGTNMFSDLFLASGSVVNFNNGDMTITHSSNKLTFNGGAIDFTFHNSDFTVTDGAVFVDSSDNSLIEFGANALTFQATNTSVNGNLNVAADIIHTGDVNNKISFGTDTQTFTTGGTARLTIADASTTIANAAIFSSSVSVADEIIHSGDVNNTIAFGTDTQTFSTGGSSRLDLSDSGLRIGGSGARVTTIEHNDRLGKYDTKLAPQGNVKAYVDANTGGNITSLGTISQDTVTFTSANADDPVIQIKNTNNSAGSQARLHLVKDRGAAAVQLDDIGSVTFIG